MDENKILEKPAENSQSVRLIGFKSLEEINILEDTLKKYIYEALEIESTRIRIERKTFSRYFGAFEFQIIKFSLIIRCESSTLLYFKNTRRVENNSEKFRNSWNKPILIAFDTSGLLPHLLCSQH